MPETLLSAVDALMTFARRFTQTPLSDQHVAELLRLDELAFGLIQQADRTVTEVELPGGRPAYSYFGRTKIPLYAPGRALHPTEAWFRMMEGFKQADPDWQRIEAANQAEQARRNAIRGELGRLAAARCADPQQCLSWCNEAIGHLSEHVRLSGGRWDNEYTAEAARLAEAVMDHARNLDADPATMASLRDLSRALVRRPLDSQAPAGAVRDMLGGLAQWCRAQQGKGSKRNRKRGRQKVTNPDADRRLLEDWQAARREGATRASFTRDRGITVDDLIKAQDRVEYRRRKGEE
jgi:hypothetical protein